MTNVEALRNLLNAITGEGSGNNNADLINAIAEAVRDGALDSLPDPKVADVGKMVGVVQFASKAMYGLVPAPLTDPIILHVIPDEENPLRGTFEENYGAISAAYGKSAFVNIAYPDGTSAMVPVEWVLYTNNVVGVKILFTSTMNGTPFFCIGKSASDDSSSTVQYIVHTYDLTPAA